MTDEQLQMLRNKIPDFRIWMLVAVSMVSCATLDNINRKLIVLTRLIQADTTGAR